MGLASVASCNIFAVLSKSQYHEVRKVCVEAILHTDNAQHFSMIKDIQMMLEMNSEVLNVLRDVYREEPDDFPMPEVVECFRQPDNRRLLIEMFLHVADISNSTKPFPCQIWAMKVLEEFFLQGDSEKSLGVPVQPLNDRERVNRAFSQINFIEFLVSPLLFVVVRVLPPMGPSAVQLIENVKEWHQLWLCDTQPPPTEADSRTLAERISKLKNRCRENLT